MDKVIVIANEKGGVGKSTTAVNLAACLREQGKRVLFIDTDPQRNSSDTYRAKVDGVATLYDVLCDGVELAEAIQHTENGDIVAGDPALKAAPKVLTGILDFMKLRKAIEPVRDEYDFCVIDTQPTSNILTQNALVAADDVIVPICAGRYSLQGLNDFYRSITELREVNPGLNIAGLLLTIVRKNTSINTETLELLPDVAQKLGTRAFAATIRQGAVVEKAQKEREPVVSFDPKSGVAEDYRSFTTEYLSYIG